MLTCTKCLLKKSRPEFYTAKSGSAASYRKGATYWCKKCYAKNYVDNKDRQQLSNQKSRIKRRYGLNWEKYQELVIKGCMICKSKVRLNVDHCHTTGNTRGILCNNCNLVVGHSKEKPELLRQIADWLETEPNIAQGLPGQVY